MERKKLVYNAIQDLWKIASQEFANKSIVDMEDGDWTELISAIDASSKKYHKLRPEESEFYDQLCSAFMDLIEHEIKTEVTVENTHPSPTCRMWLDPKRALEIYGIEIPEREPNK